MLRDNEPGRRHNEDWPSVHPRLAGIRGVLEEFDGDRVAVGEVYLLDQRALARYVTTGEELHLAHNFVFLNLPWSAERFRAVVDEFEELTRAGGWPAWCLNNHDHSRTATRYGFERARVAAMLTLTLRGTPFVFQGEELGLTDVPVAPDAIVDVDGRDPERAPIPWSPPSEAGPGAGFSSARPWLPVHPDAERLAASVQTQDPGSPLAFCRAPRAAPRDAGTARRQLPLPPRGARGNILAQGRGGLSDDRRVIALSRRVDDAERKGGPRQRRTQKRPREPGLPCRTLQGAK